MTAGTLICATARQFRQLNHEAENAGDERSQKSQRLGFSSFSISIVTCMKHGQPYAGLQNPLAIYVEYL